MLVFVFSVLTVFGTSLVKVLHSLKISECMISVLNNIIGIRTEKESETQRRNLLITQTEDDVQDVLEAS